MRYPIEGYKMPLKQAVPTWKSVDVDDTDSLRQLEEREELEAEVRIRNAVQEFEKAGVIDSSGRRIRQDLPADMSEGSGCEV